MSIKAKLLLSTLSEILLIVIFGVFMIVSYRQTSHISTNEAKASSIVESITDLRFLVFDNLLHHYMRSFNQWQLKDSELAKLLASYPSTGPQEKSYVNNISKKQSDRYSVNWRQVIVPRSPAKTSWCKTSTRS